MTAKEFNSVIMNLMDKRKVMFVTLSPCVTCATLIANSGFSRVYYLDEWKELAGLMILQAAGIRTHKVVL